MGIASRLSRKTSSLAWIAEIDGFRFFAIFAVLIYHLNTHFGRTIDGITGRIYYENSWLYHIAYQGSIGVNVFFGISGFILALPFARQYLFDANPVNLRGYYIRRITRLEPPYLLSLVLFFFVHILILHENWIEILPNFFASVFYVHSIVYDKWSKINPVAWSLEVEVQFYILAPILARFFSVKNPAWRRIILITVIVGSILHYNYNYTLIEALHLRKSLLMYLHLFLIGFLFADLFLTDWSDRLRLRSYWFDLVGVVAMSALLIYNEPFNLGHDLIFSIALFVCFICLFKGKFLNLFFTNTWVVIIGGMCYSIYLLHYAIIAFLAEYTVAMFNQFLGYAGNFLIQFLIIVPIVIIISGIYFVLIERPCMDKNWPAKLKAKIISIFA